MVDAYKKLEFSNSYDPCLFYVGTFFCEYNTVYYYN